MSQWRGQDLHVSPAAVARRREPPAPPLEPDECALERGLATRVACARHDDDALVRALAAVPRALRGAARVVAIRQLGPARASTLCARAFGGRLDPFGAARSAAAPPEVPRSTARATYDLARARGVRDVVDALVREGADPSGQLAHDLLDASDRNVSAAARALLRASPARYRDPGRRPRGATRGRGTAIPTPAAGLLGAAERRAITLFRREVGAVDEGDPDHPAVEASLRRRGSGEPLPARLREEMEGLLGVDLGRVRIHTDDVAAAAAGAVLARAFTVGEDVFFAAGAFAPGSAVGRELLVHELTHVRQGYQGRLPSTTAGGVTLSDPSGALEREAEQAAARASRHAAERDPTTAGSSSSLAGGAAVLHRALPAAIVWGAKAVAATTVDAFLDFAIAAILGLPAPGALDHVTNFLINLVPFLGEAKKAKKIKKILALVGKIVGPIKKMKELKIKGAERLMSQMIEHAGLLKDQLAKLEFDKAKSTFSRLLGYVREAQVATKLQSKGATIEHLGKTIKSGGKQLTDIDVIAREGGDLVLTQVKSGNAAVLTPGSDSWTRFANQAQRTKEAAESLRATNGGALPRLRYVVDDITPEAKSYLESLGFAVEVAGDFLK